MKTEVRRLRGRCLDIWYQMTGEVIAIPVVSLRGLKRNNESTRDSARSKQSHRFETDCLPCGRRASDLKKCSKLLSVLLNPRNDVDLAMTKSNDDVIQLPNFLTK
jgi:hypothetical protein